MTSGLSLQRYGEEIADEQEVLIAIADMVIAVACAESALMRALSVADEAGYHASAASIYVNDAASRVEAAAKYVLAAMAEGDTLRTHLAALRRLLKVTPIDTVRRRRQIADETVRRGRYIFNEMVRHTILVVLAALAFGCNAGAPPPPESEADYLRLVQVDRTDKDDAFRNQPNQPVPSNKVGEFLPLKYFPTRPRLCRARGSETVGPAY